VVEFAVAVSKQRTVEGTAAIKDLPFEQVVEILKPGAGVCRDKKKSRCVQVCWRADNEAVRAELPGSGSWSVGARVYQSAKFDLTLELGSGRGRITGGREYATGFYSPEGLERLKGRESTKRRLSAHVLRSPPDGGRMRGRAVKPVELVAPEAERKGKLLEEWNDTGGLV